MDTADPGTVWPYQRDLPSLCVDYAAVARAITSDELRLFTHGIMFKALNMQDPAQDPVLHWLEGQSPRPVYIKQALPGTVIAGLSCDAWTGREYAHWTRVLCGIQADLWEDLREYILSLVLVDHKQGLVGIPTVADFMVSAHCLGVGIDPSQRVKVACFGVDCNDATHRAVVDTAGKLHYFLDVARPGSKVFAASILKEDYMPLQELFPVLERKTNGTVDVTCDD